MTKIFVVILGEERTCQKPPCTSLALKPRAARGTVPVSRVAQPQLCWPSQPSAPATPQLLWRGSQQHRHSSSLEKHPGAEEMKLKVLKCHKQECPSLSSVTGLCCTAALSRGQDCAGTQGHCGPSELQPPQPWSSCWGLCSAAPPQPAFASSDGAGHTSVPSSRQGHPVWLICWFVFPVIQTSPSQVSPVLACLWSLPGPQAVAVPLSGQVLSPSSSLRRGRFKRAHCQKCAYSWAVNKHIPLLFSHFSDISSFGCWLINHCPQLLLFSWQ